MVFEIGRPTAFESELTGSRKGRIAERILEVAEVLEVVLSTEKMVGCSQVSRNLEGQARDDHVANFEEGILALGCS